MCDITPADLAATVTRDPNTAPAPNGLIEIWTDGSCRPNPGPGGWAAIMRNSSGAEKRISGAERDTTNNRMELVGAIRALDALSCPRLVTMHLDSEYVLLGVTARLAKWKAKGWRTADGKPVMNADLWSRLENAAARHEVTWRWVRGHAGEPMSERADALANTARERLR